MPVDKNVRIVLPMFGKGDVFVDGEKFGGVKRVSVTAGVEEFTEVTLTFAAKSVEFEGVAKIAEKTAHFGIDRFRAFRHELDKLCRNHNISLAVSGDDQIVVSDFDEKRDSLHANCFDIQLSDIAVENEKQKE